LAAYAQHGGRKMIEESDVITLMKRYAMLLRVQVTYHVALTNIPLQESQDYK
jgi:hypothetical protein